jgi:hypothetical protein
MNQMSSDFQIRIDLQGLIGELGNPSGLPGKGSQLSRCISIGSAPSGGVYTVCHSSSTSSEPSSSLVISMIPRYRRFLKTITASPKPFFAAITGAYRMLTPAQNAIYLTLGSPAPPIFLISRVAPPDILTSLLELASRKLALCDEQPVLIISAQQSARVAG